VAALEKLPPAEPTARLRDRWWQLPEYGRLFFSDVFMVAHLPEHRDFYLENMRLGDEFDFEIIPHRIACALALLGDADALEEASEYRENNAHDPEAFEVAELLHAIHRLRGEEPPVLEAIRDCLLREEARDLAAQERMAKLNAAWERKMSADRIHLPVVRKEPKAGRNDPRPCGSGKKYEKCCLQAISDNHPIRVLQRPLAASETDGRPSVRSDEGRVQARTPPRSAPPGAGKGHAKSAGLLQIFRSSARASSAFQKLPRQIF